VDPADGLVLSPDRRDIRMVEHLDHSLQARIRREDDRLRKAPVEENPEFVGEVVEDRLQIEPESAIEHWSITRGPAASGLTFWNSTNPFESLPRPTDSGMRPRLGCSISLSAARRFRI